MIAEVLRACAPKAGTLATGSACNVDGQCQSGYCELRAEGKGCGVCAARRRPPKAKAAPPSVRRAIGTRCVGVPNTSQMSCRRVSYADEKAACNGFDTQCRPGLFCAAVDGATPVCIQALAVGEECRADWYCAKEAFCSQQSAKCKSTPSFGCRRRCPSAVIGCIVTATFTYSRGSSTSGRSPSIDGELAHHDEVYTRRILRIDSTRVFGSLIASARATAFGRAYPARWPLEEVDGPRLLGSMPWWRGPSGSLQRDLTSSRPP